MRQLPEGWAEGFYWYDLGMKMNVTMAHQIVGAPYAAPDGYIHVESLRDSKSLKLVKKFDRAILSEPVLLATIGDTRLLVDGRHRAKKALVQGKSVLPCYILTEKETEQCFDGKRQQQKYRKLRDFLRKVEIKVDLYHPELRRAEKTSTTHGHHPPTVRRPR